MLTVIIVSAVVGVGSFIAGVFVGRKNKKTVDAVVEKADAVVDAIKK